MTCDSRQGAFRGGCLQRWGGGHLEEWLWLSFASKQSNKSAWRLSAELRCFKQTNTCSGEGTLSLFPPVFYRSAFTSSARHLCRTTRTSCLSLCSAVPFFFVLTSLLSVYRGNEQINSRRLWICSWEVIHLRKHRACNYFCQTFIIIAWRRGAGFTN